MNMIAWWKKAKLGRLSSWKVLSITDECLEGLREIERFRLFG